jgi:hypothetical protein
MKLISTIFFLLFGGPTLLQPECVDYQILNFTILPGTMFIEPLSIGNIFFKWQRKRKELLLLFARPVILFCNILPI